MQDQVELKDILYRISDALTVIKGNTQLAMQSGHPEKMHRYLARIAGEVDEIAVFLGNKNWSLK